MFILRLIITIFSIFLCSIRPSFSEDNLIKTGINIDQMLEELVEIEKTNKQERVDVGNIITKFIPSKSDKDTVLNILKSNRFEIYESVKKNTSQEKDTSKKAGGCEAESWVALYPIAPWYKFFIYRRDLKIFLDFECNKLVGASGYIDLTGL